MLCGQSRNTTESTILSPALGGGPFERMQLPRCAQQTAADVRSSNALLKHMVFCALTPLGNALKGPCMASKAIEVSYRKANNSRGRMHLVG